MMPFDPSPTSNTNVLKSSITDANKQTSPFNGKANLI